MPTYCFPAFTGVPGSPATNLNWWTVSSPPGQNNYPEDPDWLGAFSISEGDGAGVHVQFRALNGVDGATRYLYLSWIVRVAPLPTTNIDGINLLLGDGTNHVALKVRLATTSTIDPVTGNQTNYAIQTYSYSGGTLTPHPSVPAWVSTTGRIWVNFVSPTSGLTIPWAFQIAVPLEQNLAPASFPAVTLPRGSDFKMWYESQVNSPGGVIENYPWSGAPESTSEINIIPAGLVPQDVRVPTSSSDPACATGVTLDWGSLGLKNVDGTTRANPYAIQVDLGAAAPPYNTSITPDVSAPEHQNMFFAQPTVTSLNNTQKAALRARFRLANWGTQYNQPTADSWETVPGGESVNYDTTNNEFRFIWPRPPIDAYTTNFINGIKTYLNTNGASGRHPHQCLFVELSSTDASVIFTKSSVYTNMNFVNASLFQRIAEVSVVGLAPISFLPRDVYLYLETFNMPKVVGTKPTDGQDGDMDTHLAALKRRKIDEVEDLLTFVPTYRVHAYHDTGKMLELVDGSRVKILRPQTSFGYFVGHEGDLYGWESRIEGATRIAENFYLIPVPNDGVAKIVTKIQARESVNERPLPQQPIRNLNEMQGCLLRLLALFGPIGDVIARLLKLK